MNVANSTATSTEQVVRAIWEAELKVENLDSDSDFFELGGDSATMMTVLFQIKEALGVEVAAGTFFTEPTLGTFVRAVEMLIEGGTVEGAI